MITRAIGLVRRRVLMPLFVALGVVLALNTLTYLNFDPDYGFLKLKQAAVATGWYLPFYYVHVLTGGIILVSGFIQFNRTIRARWRRLHRVLGYTYVGLILFFSAPGGMVMSFFIDRGWVVQLSFVVQCSLWAAFTWRAFAAAKERDFEGHERWMMRSFALTVAAITLRIYIFAASWFVDLSDPAAYGILSWCSWLPNLAWAEWKIRQKITSVAKAEARHVEAVPKAGNYF